MSADIRPHRKQRQKEPKSQPVPNGTERLKTVIRRLPPNLPEDIFWQSVQAWVTDDTVTWKSYFPGKLRTKRLNKEGIPSRAYIAFKNEEQVATFSREYDGHVFRDKTGNESQAIVEFAPFQKVPTEKKKVDARNNTIDKDEDYLSFLEMLKNGEKAESVALEALIAASQPPPPPTTTPLLEALKAEKSAQKDRETILRNHAHYKDAAASGASSKKEEAKKKAAVAAAQATKQAEPSAPLSRKAKKAAAAVQKAPPTQPQDGQGTSPIKNQPPPAVLSSGAKTPTPTSVVGHVPRHRHPKERPHPHPGKGDAALPPSVHPSASVSVFTSGSTPGSMSTKPGPTPPASAVVEAASQGSPAPAVVPGPARKSRPSIGLGRQLEAALSGAGVAVVPGSGGDRKKRDKGSSGGGNEPGPGVGAGAGVGAASVPEGGGAGQGAGRQGGGVHGPSAPAVVIPSILQRPEGGSSQPDVMAVQRPHSPRATEASGSALAGHEGEGSFGVGGPRGGGRRGRGRGRGGHRGG